MNRLSRMKEARDTLAMYPLMKTPDVAGFLNCDTDQVRRLAQAGRLPFIDVGLGERVEYRLDPVTVVVFVLGQTEGMTVDEYWEEYGPEGTPDRARHYIAKVRRFSAIGPNGELPML